MLWSVGAIGGAHPFRPDEQDRLVVLAQVARVAADQLPDGVSIGALPPAAAHDAAGETVGFADEGGDEGAGRVVVDRPAGAHLLDHAARHHADPVGHGQRFALIVGDVDEGDAGALLDRAQFGAHVLAQLQVERGQRLVEQQGPRVRPRARGRWRRAASGRRTARSMLLVGRVGQGHQIQELLRALGGGVGLRDAPDFEPEGDVLRRPSSAGTGRGSGRSARSAACWGRCRVMSLPPIRMRPRSAR